MKILYVLLAVFLTYFMLLADKFVTAKIRNDSNISNDTRRCADALEEIVSKHYRKALL